MKGRPMPKSDEAPWLELDATIHVRCSTELKEFVRERAAKDGMEPSTWVRVQLLKIRERWGRR
jgi:predicted DNA binding CopG/RHH family protein